MKFTVYFNNTFGGRVHLGIAPTREKANVIISNFLKKHDYKSYYWREQMNEDKSEISIDVGSWSESFTIVVEEPANKVGRDKRDDGYI